MPRQLKELISVGPATIDDLKVLGIERVDQLVDKDPTRLHQELCDRTGIQHNICCLDVFRAAIEQARDPELPKEKCNWWYWSKQRKQGQ